ncbi:hypothetical protein [Agromyces sp. Marseille-P2726]|uniref:hypothetical protein n=1 Tax=Agromyces sp. Marseille-P2726 TaxID=2709132 RepID=UPI00157087D1|nr:hypothetical protein [Agromyces sp. Marseille-P2726]
MNARALLLVPAAVVVAVLAGCGQTDGNSLSERGSGSVEFRFPSTEICNQSSYIRERAPEGLCEQTTVDDDLSPTSGK